MIANDESCSYDGASQLVPLITMLYFQAFQHPMINFLSKVPMGEDVLTNGRPADGIYFLTTNGEEPRSYNSYEQWTENWNVWNKKKIQRIICFVDKSKVYLSRGPLCFDIVEFSCIITNIFVQSVMKIFFCGSRQPSTRWSCNQDKKIAVQTIKVLLAQKH